MQAVFLKLRKITNFALFNLFLNILCLTLKPSFGKARMNCLIWSPSPLPSGREKKKITGSKFSAKFYMHDNLFKKMNNSIFKNFFYHGLTYYKLYESRKTRYILRYICINQKGSGGGHGFKLLQNFTWLMVY